MTIKLSEVYDKISLGKKHKKLHIEGLTADQIYYQIDDLTDRIIKNADIFLYKGFHLDDVISVYEAEKTEIDDKLVLPSENSADILKDSKVFFGKMDEDVSTIEELSDTIDSSYLEQLELDS